MLPSSGYNDASAESQNWDLQEILSHGDVFFTSDRAVFNPLHGIEEGKSSVPSRTTDISKMKGQSFSCRPNAQLVVVSGQYIVYAMKEGTLRIIPTAGNVEMFRVSNQTGNPIIDMSLYGLSRDNSSGTGAPLLFLDNGGHVTWVDVFRVSRARTDEARQNVPRTELIFSENDFPLRVLTHPTDANLALTFHKDCATILTLSKFADTPATGTSRRGEFTFVEHEIRRSSVASHAFQTFYWMPCGELNPFVDGLITPTGSHILILTRQQLFVWVMSVGKRGESPCIRLTQQLALTQLPTTLPIESVRVVGSDSAAAQVLMFVAPETCEFHIYEFFSSREEPVALLAQSIGFASENGMHVERVSVDCSSYEIITISIAGHGCLVFLPLARGWVNAECGVPFPNAQIVRIGETAHQLTTLLNDDQAKILVYRANNFKRVKDDLPGCTVVVDERVPARHPPARVIPHKSKKLLEATSETAEKFLVPPTEFLAVPPSAHDSDLIVASDPQMSPLLESELGDGALTKPPEATLASQSTLPQFGKPETPLSESSLAPPGLTLPSSAGHSAGNSGAGPSQGQSLVVDRAYVRQIAANFAKGLDSRRGDLADKFVADIAAAIADSGGTNSSSGLGVSEADLLALKHALAKIREAREAQLSSEEALSAAVRKASDSWAEASATNVSAVLQRELAKTVDGVAVTLAQQLSQSRRFHEAVARGVQRVGNGASKQAFEALRPPKQLQEAVTTALGEALHESLAPVLRQELRAHFEQELAPLISRRLNEMTSSFREKMSECIEGIAEEQEEAAKRLGKEIAPAVAVEMAEVEKVVARFRGSASALSPSATAAAEDEMVRQLEKDFVMPLVARVQDLTSQVQALRQEARELERRWTSACSAFGASRGPDVMPPTPNLTGLGGLGKVESEEQQAVSLERLFNGGCAEEAFTKAIALQQRAQHVDFLGRLCALSSGQVGDWLEAQGERASPLSMKLKMLLMLALARQLSGHRQDGAPGLDLSPADCASKIEWIMELWLAFKTDDPSVQGGALDFCKQLTEQLKNTPEDIGEGRVVLRRLTSQVRLEMKLLQSL
eukprot:TRINITY_DN48440_c0_g1_i1.p1 TRINITY_DN48440_c0_g1~~TRINITY_DN48440_c0_g1_i1.p1  ORF type:complete len:1090 (+),score=154.97 TRINITY_DN48440_c0_g1_i1:44-3271(+)